MTAEDGDETRLFVAALFADPDGPDPARSSVLPLASTNPDVDDSQADETRAFVARLFAT